MRAILKRELIILAVGLFCALPFPAEAVITVPLDYPTIQEALDNAASGEKIIVSPGVYYEYLTIDKYKDYDLEGADRDTTIIDGALTGIPVSIDTTNNVFIANLTIQNSASNGINLFWVSEPDRFRLINCVIKNNNISGLSWDQIDTRFTKEMIISNCIFSNNSEYGIYLYNNKAPYTIENCEFTYNGIKGLYIADTMLNGSIESNYFAFNNIGVDVRAEARVRIIGNTIEYNVANHPDYDSYVAIYVRGGFNITRNIIQNNQAEGDGVIAAETLGGFVDFSNNYVYRNSSKGNYGTVSISSIEPEKLYISNNTITENMSSLGAGGFYFSGGKFYNNIITNNSNYGLFNTYDSCESAEVKHNNIFGNTPAEVYCYYNEYSDIDTFNRDNPLAEGNISCPPQFVAPGDYHLSDTSCCIDMGVADYAPLTDLDGESRPMGRGYDIGADEYTAPRIPVDNKIWLIILILFTVLLIEKSANILQLEGHDEEKYSSDCFRMFISFLK